MICFANLPCQAYTGGGGFSYIGDDEFLSLSMVGDFWTGTIWVRRHASLFHGRMGIGRGGSR